MSAQAHYDAVKARLEEHPKLSGVVYDALRLDREKPDSLVHENYAVIYPTGPDLLDDKRLTKGQDPESSAVYVYDGVVVAVDPGGVLLLLQAVIDQLAGYVLSVSGRRCHALGFTGADRVKPDTTVSPPLYYSEFDFILRSDRA